MTDFPLCWCPALVFDQWTVASVIVCPAPALPRPYKPSPLPPHHCLPGLTVSLSLSLSRARMHRCYWRNLKKKKKKSVWKVNICKKTYVERKQKSSESVFASYSCLKLLISGYVSITQEVRVNCLELIFGSIYIYLNTRRVLVFNVIYNTLMYLRFFCTFLVYIEDYSSQLLE